MSNPSFFQRRAMASKVLAEHAEQQTAAITEQHAQLRDEQRTATFVKTSRKSSSDFKQRLFERQAAYKTEAQIFLAEVVQAACPFDLSGIPLAEIVQQMEYIKDTYGDILKEDVPFGTIGTAPMTSVDSDGATTLVIGSLNANTASDMARKLITAKVALGTNRCLSDVGGGGVTAYNNLDTAVVAGNGSGSPENSAFKDLYARFCARFSSQLRGNVAANLKEDADRMMISDNELLEGLSELGQQRMRREIRNRAPSLLNEVFLTTKTLNETTAATEEDYLNEAVFVTTVLEAYNAVGMIADDMREVQYKLSKKRRAFAK